MTMPMELEKQKQLITTPFLVVALYQCNNGLIINYSHFAFHRCFFLNEKSLKMSIRLLQAYTIKLIKTGRLFGSLLVNGIADLSVYTTLPLLLIELEILNKNEESGSRAPVPLSPVATVYYTLNCPVQRLKDLRCKLATVDENKQFVIQL